MSTGLLNGLLGVQPNDPAGVPMQVEMLPIDWIIPNPDNNIYHVGDVSQLAEDIRKNGVRQPLEVVQTGGMTYKLIGGERRLTACQELLDGGDDRFSSLPCIVLESKGELDDRIALITANATARDLTDGERLAQYEALKEALTHKKRDGKLEGKVRDEVCRILGLSTGAAARLNVIASCENELIKERLMSGEIGLMQAYQAAQDYTRFTEANAEELEAQKAQNSKAPVTVSEKPASPEKKPIKSTATTSEDGVDWHQTATKLPEWAYQYAVQICHEDWIEALPEFTGGNLLDSCHNVHSGHPLTGGGYVNYLPRGLVLRNADRTQKVIFTWHWFVDACKACGIPATKEPDGIPRGHDTLVKLAAKTLGSLAAWELNLEEPAFKLTYYTQKLPGGAILWRQVDDTRDLKGKTDTTRYAIILQDYSFFTCGWITQAEIMTELARYFELK